MPCCPRWTTAPSPWGCFGTRGAGWRTLPAGPGTPRQRRGPRGRFRIGWEPPPAPAASAIRPEQIRKGRWRCRRGPAGCCWSTHDAATIRPPDAPLTSLPQPWRTTSRWRRCRRRTFPGPDAGTQPMPRPPAGSRSWSLSAAWRPGAMALPRRSPPGRSPGPSASTPASQRRRTRPFPRLTALARPGQRRRRRPGSSAERSREPAPGGAIRETSPLKESGYGRGPGRPSTASRVVSNASSVAP